MLLVLCLTAVVLSGRGGSRGGSRGDSRYSRSRISRSRTVDTRRSENDERWEEFKKCQADENCEEVNWQLMLITFGVLGFGAIVWCMCKCCKESEPYVPYIAPYDQSEPSNQASPQMENANSPETQQPTFSLGLPPEPLPEEKEMERFHPPPSYPAQVESYPNSLSQGDEMSYAPQDECPYAQPGETPYVQPGENPYNTALAEGNPYITAGPSGTIPYASSGAYPDAADAPPQYPGYAPVGGSAPPQYPGYLSNEAID